MDIVHWYSRGPVHKWKRLKQELQSQFFPEKVEILARRKVGDLKHTRNIWEYVKQFSVFMLDIWDMFEKDKIFHFIEGLKPWAKSKLYEQRIQDLSTTYGTAERLFDLSNEQSQDVRRSQTSSSGLFDMSWTIVWLELNNCLIWIYHFTLGQFMIDPWFYIHETFFDRLFWLPDFLL